MAVKKIPVRRCVGCGEGKPKKEMLRIVRTPEGEVCCDETGRRAGRGAYICPHGTCLAAALKKKSLERALQQPLPPEVRERLAAEVQQAEGAGEDGG